MTNQFIDNIRLHFEKKLLHFKYSVLLQELEKYYKEQNISETNISRNELEEEYSLMNYTLEFSHYGKDPKYDDPDGSKYNDTREFVGTYSYDKSLIIQDLRDAIFTLI